MIQKRQMLPKDLFLWGSYTPTGTFGLMSYVSLLAIFSHATYLILSAVSCASLETNAEICMTQFVECCAK